MDKVYRRKLEKIFTRVGNIASKGKDNVQEYFNLIDEMIEKGTYGSFTEVLDIFYDIDVIGENDINLVKTNTWKQILFQTKTPFLQKLSILYRQYNVYQQYNQIFLNEPILFPQTSNKYSATFSYTSITASVDFDRINDGIVMTVLDDDIEFIQIDKAKWKNINNVYKPTDEFFIDEYVISYQSSSNTTNNIPNQWILDVDLAIGSSMTFSTIPKKNFLPSQTIKLERYGFQSGIFAPSYREIIGQINSYEINTGELVITVNSFTYSGPQQNRFFSRNLWFISYLSGPKNPKLKTNIPVSHSDEYKISTINKNGQKWYYKLSFTSESFLGTVEEIDTFNQPTQYLVQNKQYAKILGQRKTLLKVDRIGMTQSYGIIYDNPAYTEDQNLLRRYKLAVNYLITGSTASI